MAAASNERELQSLFVKGGLVAVIQRAKADLKNVESTTLNIAVIGESGGGKSSFASLLDASGIEGGPALTAGKEAQKWPVKYQFSSDDTVSIWDFPGIQTPTKFEADAYFNSLTFDKYHFFIVLSGVESEETAWQLIKQIREKDKKKKCYFVRNKLDIYLESVKQREESQYDETKALEHLRNTLAERSKKERLESTQIFLISSLHRDKFDFQELQRTLKEELSALKKDIRSRVLCRQISSLIDKKKDDLLAETWKIAAAAASARVMAIPGSSFVCDISLLYYNIFSYRSSFGLDHSILEKLASEVGQLVKDLKAELKSTFAQEITFSRISEELLQMAGEEIVEATILEFVPLIGQAILAKRSYKSINVLLEKTVRDLAEDSKRIIRKALMLD
ncbi:interferon-gamma-inducible GTPase 10-like [Hemitrygon akajei]|uniref:interferon-gamma-inducible GTPase 10-like n=1 Tax=Hemitrygon akajei TaxID=2704970 RepID=UPI003BF944BD